MIFFFKFFMHNVSDVDLILDDENVTIDSDVDLRLDDENVTIGFRFTVIKGLNLVEVGHSNASPGGGSNTVSSGSSMQLVAVPMAFCVPLVTNLSGASSETSTVQTLLYTSDQKLLDTKLTTQQSHTGTPDGAPDSPATVKDPSRLPSAATNCIRASALAAGARIASPSDAASIIKAVRSKNAIHIRAREPSPSSLKPLGPKPLGPHAANAHFVPVDRSDTVNVVLLGDKQVQGGFGGTMTSSKAGNLHGRAALHKELKDEMATDGDSEDQTFEEGAMEFTGSEDNEEFTDAEAAQQLHTGTPDGAPDSPATVKDPSRLPSAATNCIRASALAAGARIASPSDAASIIKAVRSKNAIHIRAREPSPSSLKPLGPKPLGPHAANAHFVPVDRSDTVNVVLLGDKQVQGGFGGTMTSSKAGNLHGRAALHKELKDEMATDGDSEDQTFEEGAMEFTGSEDNEEFTDAEAGKVPNSVLF
ncbi:hypothetical protein COCNU_scaffold043395G000010 [Cocos nucifera]|nr:hypothetical protein [Cocos nucifera]